VLLIGIFGSSSIGAVSKPLVMDSSLHRTGTRTRKVVEQAVVFQLKPDLTDELKENMVQGFADLKTSSSQWVVAESAGVVPEGSQLDGEGVGLFMRFSSKKDLEAFHASKQKHAMAEKYILPYTTDMITMYFEAKVEDTDEAVYRKGDAFKNGAERIVGIKVKNGTSQEDMDTMVKAMNDLIDAPELHGLLVQITSGTNFCSFDQQFTHGIVVRCPSLKALQIYSKHEYHINVIKKTVYPFAESLFQVDYVVDSSGSRRSIHQSHFSN
jgi:hypothetical protein